MDLFLPLSNFVIASLKASAPCCYEIYFKWYLAGAQNGALLQHTGGSYEISVYRPDIVLPLKETLPKDALRIEFDEMVFDLFHYHKGSDRAETEKTIRAAFAQGKDLLFQDPSLTELVRLLQVSFLFDGGENQDSEKAQMIAQRFHERLGISPRVCHVESGPLAPHDSLLECNCEFQFEAIKEQELVRRLTPLIPELEPPVVATGALVINHDGDACRETRLKWAHLTARHFGFVDDSGVLC